MTEVPLSNMVVLEAVTGLESELEIYLKSMTLVSRQQEGCLRYDCFQSMEAESRFLLVMEWRDESSLQSHLDSSHVMDFFQEAAQRLARGFQEADYRNFSHDGPTT